MKNKKYISPNIMILSLYLTSSVTMLITGNFMGKYSKSLSITLRVLGFIPLLTYFLFYMFYLKNKKIQADEYTDNILNKTGFLTLRLILSILATILVVLSTIFLIKDTIITSDIIKITFFIISLLPLVSSLIFSSSYVVYNKRGI